MSIQIFFPIFTASNFIHTNTMKNILTSFLALLGLASACGQHNFENANVDRFAECITDNNVVLLDVRTEKEFNEGHIQNALNIDIKQDDFVEKAKATLPTEKTVAVYCRSGVRSALAANKLSAEGYKVVNLEGGILAWKKAEKPVVIDSEAYETDSFTTKNGKTVKFHALVHASIRIDYDGKEIMIDPVTKLGDKTIDYKTMPKANYIFVTHEHFDHYDALAIPKLCSPATAVYTNKSVNGMIHRGLILNNGDSIAYADDIKIWAVPAYNTTAGREQYHPKGRDNGYILSLDGLRIYIAGDTEDIPEMAALKDIDIAFLPCNQPYTMTVDQLIKAAKTIMPKVLFPYHYSETPVSQLKIKLNGSGILVKIRDYK